MKAYIFPGQGSQFPGMGKDLYDSSVKARDMFENANDILGFRITDIMFNGTEEDLKQTRVTQPAIFLHSAVKAATMKTDSKPDMVAGHSLGEFSALVANQTLRFEDALVLVSKRAIAMQKACDAKPSTMAAILGLADNTVEEVCNTISETVVPANYNCPGQLVISGSIKGVNIACEKLIHAGARRALILPVGGAFHSPLMQSAQNELEEAIKATSFLHPICPIYQNVTACAVNNPEEIKKNLITQLTFPVKWSQTVLKMIADGATVFVEVGPGKVLQGLVKKIEKNVEAMSAT